MASRAGVLTGSVKTGFFSSVKNAFTGLLLIQRPVIDILTHDRLKGG
jgi:hypothetical protein